MRKIVYNLSDGFKILFTCAGRRVALIENFREAAAVLGRRCTVYGSDITELTAAMQACDTYHKVCRVEREEYISQIIDIVDRENINIVIPTTDHDLLKLAKSTEQFAARGCFVLVPQHNIVEICQDKRKTFKFLTANGFKTPKTFEPSDIAKCAAISFPCFLKPWDGYASRGATVVYNQEEFSFYSKRIPNCIAQQYIEGTEITCDVFTDADACVRCVVPRKRIETRAGEVSKASIIKHADIIDEVSKLAAVMQTSLCMLTIQLIQKADGSIYFIEINPRFGGGVPLAVKAGANFPLWLLEHLTGLECNANNGYKENLTMLRYDAAVWLEQQC